MEHASSCSKIGSSFDGHKSGTVLYQPPYSPDLVFCDFSFFPKLKSVLQGIRFDTTDGIKSNSSKA